MKSGKYMSVNWVITDAYNEWLVAWLVASHSLNHFNELTHWGRVTHICVGELTIIVSDNGLSPGQRQAIIWTNAGILLIGPYWWTKFQWNFNRNSNIFIHENEFESVVCEMMAILSQPQCVNVHNNWSTHGLPVRVWSGGVFSKLKVKDWSLFYCNSLWHGDVTWSHRYGSTLAQIMACCLMALSHYQNQCWLIISKVLWHSPEGDFTGNVHVIYPCYDFEND